jgi:hypothetical protein
MADFSDDEILERLARIGVKDASRYLSFQHQYGGRSEPHGVMTITWGIIHTRPFDMQPNEVEWFDFENGYAACPRLRCLDADIQDTLYLDEVGGMYDCCGRKQSDSFEMMFAQSDFLDSFHFNFDLWKPEIIQSIKPDNDTQIIVELSDSSAQLYTWRDHVLRVREGSVNAIYSRNLKRR